MAVLFLALSTLRQFMTSRCLSLFFVYLAPQALIAKDVPTRQPFWVLCKNTLADGTLELFVHLVKKVHIKSSFKYTV